MGDVSECAIKVICRVRPLNDAEERAGNQLVVRVAGDDSVSLSVRDSLNFLEPYSRALYCPWSVAT